MSIFSSKKQTITISIDNEHCIRSIPVEGIGYDTTVIVETGCVGIYVVNGRPRQPILEPGRYLINDKRERGLISSFALIGANVNKEFEILCGVGGLPYRDPDLDYDAKVGISADMRVHIVNPWELYTAMGNRDLSEREINDYVRGQCISVLQAELTKRLTYCTYDMLPAQAEKMGQKVEERLRELFLNKGIRLVDGSLVLGSFHFDDEYLAMRRRVQDTKRNVSLAKDEAEIKRQRDLADLEALKNVKDMFGKRSDTAEAALCPICGSPIPAGAASCPNCGRKF